MNTHGFFKAIILIIIALGAISYYGFDLEGALEKYRVKEYAILVWENAVFVWDAYLKDIFLFIWNDIIVNFIIEPLGNILERTGEAGENVEPADEL